MPTQQQMEKMMQEIMSDSDLKKIYDDPVVFSRAVLDIEPRWYQAFVLRHDNIYRIARWGRRSGKCISERSTVMTEKGPVNVAELEDMDQKPAILTFDENNHNIKKTGTYHVFPNGTKPVYKITTSTGRVNFATGNHPYLTIGKDGTFDWVDVDDLDEGDRIAVPSTYEGMVDGDDSLSPREARLIGYLIGDGCTRQTGVSFSNQDKSVLDDIRNIVDDFGCDLNHYSGFEYGIVGREFHQNNVLKFCKQHGFNNTLSVDKAVPDAVMGGTEEIIAHFLSAYWDCDGWCTIEKEPPDKSHPRCSVEIGACSASKELAYGIQHLLLRLGIVSRLRHKKIKYNGGHNDAWTVTIGDAENILKFASRIHLRSEKKENLAEIVEKLPAVEDCKNKYLNTIPQNIWSYVKAVQEEKGILNREVCGEKACVRNGQRLRTQYAVSRKKMQTYAENLDDNYLQRLSRNDILWDKIVSIEYMGREPTYDLTVPETHNFISDDIISHNTYALIMHMLWYAFTKPDSKQLVVCPFSVQVDTIFDEMKKMIREAPLVEMSVTRSVKSPQRIEFGNGSQILGLSAGTSSSSGAKSTRGQGADFIYLDEADYLSEDDFNAILGISLESMGEIGVWACSTPTGARKMFWKWCTGATNRYSPVGRDDKRVREIKNEQGNGWSEFHFPAWVKPGWDENEEARLRALFSEEGYTHEILAEFGTETTGVFNKQCIDSSRYNYTYEQMSARSPMPDTIRVISADWDNSICPNIKCRELLGYPKVA